MKAAARHRSTSARNPARFGRRVSKTRETFETEVESSSYASSCTFPRRSRFPLPRAATEHDLLSKLEQAESIRRVSEVRA